MEERVEINTGKQSKENFGGGINEELSDQHGGDELFILKEKMRVKKEELEKYIRIAEEFGIKDAKEGKIYDEYLKLEEEYEQAKKEGLKKKEKQGNFMEKVYSQFENMGKAHSAIEVFMKQKAKELLSGENSRDVEKTMAEVSARMRDAIRNNKPFSVIEGKINIPDF